MYWHWFTKDAPGSQKSFYVKLDNDPALLLATLRSLEWAKPGQQVVIEEEAPPAEEIVEGEVDNDFLAPGEMQDAGSGTTIAENKYRPGHRPPGPTVEEYDLQDMPHQDEPQRMSRDLSPQLQ